MRQPSRPFIASASIVFSAVLAVAAVDGGEAPRVRTGPPVGAIVNAAADEGCARRESTVRPEVLARPELSLADRRERGLRLQVMAATTGPCSAAEFAALQGPALVEALATAGSCLDTLWSFDPNVRTVVAPDNVSLVASAISSAATDLKAHAPRVESLAYFFQIAFYHEFYESSVTYSAATFDAAQLSLVAVSASGRFLDEDPALRDLREQWAYSTDSTNGTHRALAAVQAMLERFRDNPGLHASYIERVTVFQLFSSIARQVWNAHLLQGPQSVWYDLVTADLLGVIADYALDLNYTTLTEPLVNNALFVLGRFAYLNPATEIGGQSTLSTAYAIHEVYSGPWFRTLIELENHYDARLADGTQLDVEGIRAEVRVMALPNLVVHDGGALVVQTALTQEHVGRLYDAIQEVESQFYRKTTLLDPTPGDANDDVTLVIYSSPHDYELYQPFLYGLSTDNGGIYIESWGTLFTYDRDSWESVYTLEQLLRHEFVHYLDGRYVVVPLFGEGIYEGERLTWYTEGLAEYLVGSTRVEGVLPRRVLVQQIEADSERMTVAEIVEARYADGFRFYNYTGMFFEFLAREQPSLLAELFTRVRGNDAATLDAFFAQLAGDATLQAGFDARLDQLRDDLTSGSGRFAEDVPTTPTTPHMPGGNADELHQILLSTLPTATGDFVVQPGRFRYTDVIEVDLPLSAARAELDALMDDLLLDLTPQSANFRSAVAWFGNFDVAGGSTTARYVIEGPYLENSLWPPSWRGAR